ncbi:MAG: DUF4492 domain-containing protein [Bacteroidales bacterium]|nr:DUF4492 domain-containing protein [Bacteroidales bacterium]
METLKRIWLFYYEGFSSMTSMGRALWVLIIVKLFVMFVVLRVFFFKPALAKYDTPEAKSQAVIENLVK